MIRVSSASGRVCYGRDVSQTRQILFGALLAGALFAAFTARPGRAQEGGDLQAQILYAFHTEDTHELDHLVQSLTVQMKSGTADAALRYHLAHAQYRMGLLEAPAKATESQGAAAFSDCIDVLRPLIAQDVKSVEALALQSACYSELARYRRIQAVLLNARAADRMNAAYALAPRNPRVVYLKALADLSASKRGSVQNDQAFALLNLAAQLFEESSATRTDVPGWGHAEAYLALGVQLKERGDLIGARNWIEKALIAAPDFRAAQRELAGLVQH